MKKCIKCSLPETYIETLEFAESQDTCNMCIQHEFRTDSIDWGSRKKRLDKIIEENRGKWNTLSYRFQSGKDSTFTLYYLMKEYNLKPLVVQFNHGFMRPTLQKNNERTFKMLGVDVISFTPNWKVVKRVMLDVNPPKRATSVGIAIQIYFLIRCK